MNVIVAVAVALLLGAVIVLAWWAGESRRRALTAWALAHGLTFSRERDPEVGDRYAAFPCLQQGDNRYAYNVVRGSLAGHPACAFDFHFQTYSHNPKGGRQTHHHHFSAVVLHCALPLRPLRLRPETFFDRVGEFFGLDDIDFESAEFSRAFHVQAADRRWAFDVIHQAAMEFLLGAPRFHVELQAGGAMAWRNHVMPVDDVEAAASVAAGILDRMPASVLEELRDPDGRAAKGVS